MSRRTSLPGAAELFRTTGEEPAVVPARPPEAAPATAPALRAQQLLAQAPGPAPAPTSAQALLTTQAPLTTQALGTAAAPGTALAPDSAAAPGAPQPLGSAQAPAVGPARPTRRRVAPDAERRPTGRERHEEKITVYVSPEELMDLERARLVLRGDHGLAVDRGRIVREALAVVLEDLEANGERSTLVRRLQSS